MEKILMHKMILAKSSIVTLYILLAGVLLFIAFNTSTLNATTLIYSYSSILFGFVLLSKLTNQIIKE